MDFAFVFENDREMFERRNIKLTSQEIALITIFFINLFYKIKTFSGDAILILVAVIWGSTIAVQKVAMENLDPLYFTSIRFSLGGLFLIPILFMSGFLSSPTQKQKTRASLIFGTLGGLTIAAAASLQQVGLIYTTPTKAGFLTSFFIIFTPLIALFMKKKPRKEFG